MTKQDCQNRAWQDAALVRMGFSEVECDQLRRISRTLRRWFELECGTENAAGSSVSVEREGGTDDGKPFLRVQYRDRGGTWVDRRFPVADRETGARKRLANIMAGKSGVLAYIQGDCRGCALHLVPSEMVKPGESLDSVYNRGVAVY